MADLEAKLRELLQKLEPTKESIQTVAYYFDFHRRFASVVVRIWGEELFASADAAHKLNLLYLANEVLQTFRKKGDAFLAEFARVLPSCVKHFSDVADDKTKQRAEKTLSVWATRQIYDKEFINCLIATLHNKAKHNPVAFVSAPAVQNAVPLPSHVNDDPVVKPLLVVENCRKEREQAAMAVSKIRAELLTPQIAHTLDFQDPVVQYDLHSAIDAIEHYRAQLEDELKVRAGAMLALSSFCSEEGMSVTEEKLKWCEEEYESLRKAHSTHRPILVADDDEEEDAEGEDEDMHNGNNEKDEQQQQQQRWKTNTTRAHAIS
eukprot:GILJ01008965.1.p1 GENE.GILJ01008965.1~~GILJ01008965.1.p1  ORF type:complete len:320 (+),score=75.21 GILJ01008965.1:55-1014(+)